MCAILSNSLENALEAAGKCHERKVINMKSGMRGNIIMFEIENPIHGNGSELMLISDKNGGLHGYGIPNMRRIAEQYHGEVTYKIQDDRFYTTIILCGKSQVR